MGLIVEGQRHLFSVIIKMLQGSFIRFCLNFMRRKGNHTGIGPIINIYLQIQENS